MTPSKRIATNLAEISSSIDGLSTDDFVRVRNGIITELSPRFDKSATVTQFSTRSDMKGLIDTLQSVFSRI